MFDLADPENHPSGAKALLILCGLSARLEHFAEWCRPGFHWYPTHFRKKRGNGWGTGVYSKSENALEPLDFDVVLAQRVAHLPGRKSEHPCRLRLHPPRALHGFYKPLTLSKASFMLAAEWLRLRRR